MGHDTHSPTIRSDGASTNPAPASPTPWFLNDGDDEVVEYNSNKDVVAIYVPGPAIDEPIAMVTPTAMAPTATNTSTPTIRAASSP